MAFKKAQQEVLNALARKSLATFVIYILRGSKLAYKYAIFKFVWVREGRMKVVGQPEVVHFSCNAKQLNNAPSMMNYSRF